MGGLASKRCDACGAVAMISDRGTVLTVEKVKKVGADAEGTDRAICACGQLVSWPRTRAEVPSTVPTGALANAHPRRDSECKRTDHDPLNSPIPSSPSGSRIVTVQNICKRCGAVYAREAFV